MPIGGIILRNGSKYGSQMFVKKRPTFDSLVDGTHDIKM